MKRFFTFLTTFSLAGTFGRHPVIAGVLSLLGIGGGAGIAMLTTPTILPQVSSNFNPNAPVGQTNNGLTLVDIPSTDGPLFMPSTPTNSFAWYFEMNVDSALGFSSGLESPFVNASVQANGVPGQPVFYIQKQLSGSFGSNEPQWLLSSGAAQTGTASATAGTGYNSGYYPFTATGGSCSTEPTGMWNAGTTLVKLISPGFNCAATPTVTPATILGVGAKQSTSSTSCTAGIVTTHVPIAHGIAPGATFPMTTFSPAGYNTTYTAIAGTSGTTLVGTAVSIGSTCPTGAITEGLALAGTGATITMPSLSTTAPFHASIGTNTGINVKNNQHICGIVGEYGADSAFPGAQYVHMVDDNGNALNGAPGARDESQSGHCCRNRLYGGIDAISIVARDQHHVTALLHD